MLCTLTLKALKKTHFWMWFYHPFPKKLGPVEQILYCNWTKRQDPSYWLFRGVKFYTWILFVANLHSKYVVITHTSRLIAFYIDIYVLLEVSVKVLTYQTSSRCTHMCHPFITCVMLNIQTWLLSYNIIITPYCIMLCWNLGNVEELLGLIKQFK